MTLITRVREAVKLSREWFKENQNEDFGWSRLKSTQSYVMSVSEAIDALITLGEDPSSPQVRKGVLWLLENSHIWGKETLKGDNNLANRLDGLDELCWGLLGLSRFNNIYAQKVFSEKMKLLLSRQITKVKDEHEKKYLGLFVEMSKQTKELVGLYSSALALKIMCKYLPPQDKHIQKLIQGLKRHRTKDGWPTQLTKTEDLEPDPCYTAHIADSLLCAGESVNEPYLNESLRFLENELKAREYLWSKWVEEPFEREDEKEQASTEATGQGLLTLLRAGYDVGEESVIKSTKWLLSDDIFIWKGDDKGGFRLYPGSDVYNFSTYYGSIALKAFLDITQSWEELNAKYRFDSTKLDIKNKASLNQHFIETKATRAPITLSYLRQLGLFDKVIKGKIKDEDTIKRIEYTLKVLNEDGPIPLDKLENRVREYSEPFKKGKKSWTREMFTILSRLHAQNLVVLYGMGKTIKEKSFPTSESEYTELVLQDVKIWTLLDL